MPSSLLNAPHPNTRVVNYHLARDPLNSDRDEREMRARRYYLELAAKGDHGAILLLKTHWRLTRLVIRGKEVF